MKTFKKHLKDKLTNKRFKDKFDEEKRLLEISMQIHNFREKKGMSQSDTAKLAKITQQQLSKIENGENCNLMTFLKVCSALNIDIDFKESKKSHAGAWLGVDALRGARVLTNRIRRLRLGYIII